MNATLEMPVSEVKLKAVPPPENEIQILLMDDDLAVRKVLHDLLMEENYVVLTAITGAEALEIVKTVKIDLILLDLNIPIKDGWEPFEQLMAENPLLPVILITNHPNKFSPALSLGVGALLEKPLNFVKLFQTIRSLLEEPKELRKARRNGHPSLFRYIPPKYEDSMKADEKSTDN